MTGLVRGADMLKRLHDYGVTYLLLAVLAAMILLWTVLAVAVLAPLPARRRRAAARHSMMAGLRLFTHFLSALGAYRFELGALDTLAGEPGLILAPNHPSALDAIVLLSRHPNLACVLKPQLLTHPLLGPGARLAQFISSEPPRVMVRAAIAELGRGAAVLLFPEGTRSVRAPVNPLTASVAVIAKHARAPIQMVLIETDSTYLGKGWPALKAPRLPIRYRVRLGARLQAPADVAACTRELAARFAAELAAPWHRGSPPPGPPR